MEDINQITKNVIKLLEDNDLFDFAPLPPLVTTASFVNNDGINTITIDVSGIRYYKDEDVSEFTLDEKNQQLIEYIEYHVETYNTKFNVIKTI